MSTTGADPAAVASTGTGAVPDPGPVPLEPWKAVALTTVWPGLGHVYAGAPALGVALAVAQALVIALILAGALAPGLPAQCIGVGVILDVALALYSLLDAHRRARVGASPEFEHARTSARDAWKALFLGRVLPGIGQLYDGRVLPGLGFLLAAFVAFRMPGEIGSVLQAIVSAAALAESWRHARARRVGEPREGDRFAIAAAVLTLVLGLLGVELRDHLVRAYSNAGGGMAPTLHPGDKVFADLTRHGRAEIGELIVFPYPPDPRALFIKRVFAVAGDVVEFGPIGAVRNGRRIVPSPVMPDGVIASFGAPGHPYRVPPGSVFVLGDYPLNSRDSRFFGPVPVSTVLGRATKIYWPLDRARPLTSLPQLP